MLERLSDFLDNLPAGLAAAASAPIPDWLGRMLAPILVGVASSGATMFVGFRVMEHDVDRLTHELAAQRVAAEKTDDQRRQEWAAMQSQLLALRVDVSTLSVRVGILEERLKFNWREAPR